MSTYTQSIHQVVFATKNRKPCLSKVNRPELFKYIWGIIKNSNCHLYRINGVEDHLHIATSVHQSISLANLVKNIKLASSQFIKEQNLFEGFNGWQEGYGAFTYSHKDKAALVNYVMNQEEHHKIKTFEEEYRELLFENGIEFDEKYLL